jgi:hypothetical protein
LPAFTNIAHYMRKELSLLRIKIREAATSFLLFGRINVFSDGAA